MIYDKQHEDTFSVCSPEIEHPCFKQGHYRTEPGPTLDPRYRSRRRAERVLPKYTVLSHLGHFDAIFRQNRSSVRWRLRDTPQRMVAMRMRMEGEE